MRPAFKASLVSSSAEPAAIGFARRARSLGFGGDMTVKTEANILDLRCE
jgi:hypothetical protein